MKTSCLVLFIFFVILLFCSKKKTEHFAAVPYEEMRKMMFCRYSPGHPECQPVNLTVLSNVKPESIGYLKKGTDTILPIFRQFDYSTNKWRYLTRVKKDDWEAWRPVDLGYEPFEGGKYVYQNVEYVYHESESLLGNVPLSGMWNIPTRKSLPTKCRNNNHLLASLLNMLGIK